jgi:hypothetical protein
VSPSSQQLKAVAVAVAAMAVAAAGVAMAAAMAAMAAMAALAVGTNYTEVADWQVLTTPVQRAH